MEARNVAVLNMAESEAAVFKIQVLAVMLQVVCEMQGKCVASSPSLP